ncbi:MAG: hypothetical protein AAB883_03485 [Patescibacteria group bacterium]
MCNTVSIGFVAPAEVLRIVREKRKYLFNQFNLRHHAEDVEFKLARKLEAEDEVRRVLMRRLEHVARGTIVRPVLVGLGQLSHYGTSTIYLPLLSEELREMVDILHDECRGLGLNIHALECSQPAIVLAEGLTEETFGAVYEMYTDEGFPHEIMFDSLSVRDESSGDQIYAIQLAQAYA